MISNKTKTMIIIGLIITLLGLLFFPDAVGPIILLFLMYPFIIAIGCIPAFGLIFSFYVLTKLIVKFKTN